MIRRPLSLCALSILSSACIFDPTTSSSGTGTGGSTSASTTTTSTGVSKPCDDKKDCAACLNCAAQVQCAGPIAACNQSSTCFGLDQCIGICGADPACKQQCFDGNPDGVTLYLTAISCLYCDQCANDCTGYMTCQ